jgi:hypothetical protein
VRNINEIGINAQDAIYGLLLEPDSCPEDVFADHSWSRVSASL